MLASRIVASRVALCSTNSRLILLQRQLNSARHARRRPVVPPRTRNNIKQDGTLCCDSVRRLDHCAASMASPVLVSIQMLEQIHGGVHVVADPSVVYALDRQWRE